MGLQRNSKVVSSFLWYHVVPFRNETWQWKILRVLAVHPPSSHPLPTSAATRSMAFSTASLVSGLAFLQGSPQVNKVGSSNPVSIVIFAINPSYTQVLSRRLHVWNIYYSYICPKNGPNVGKYDIHGASGKRLFYGQFDGGVMGVEWDLWKDSMRFNGNLMGIDIVI